ncbi:MAG: hypothetical protein PHC78_00645, partial [Verrucomicrobiota bacterium]|nr:hypothetical protein [Verrucomicrobiota bacterium]
DATNWRERQIPGELEAVRKAEAAPSGTGESRAEAQRRQGVSDLVMGVGGGNALIQTFWGFFSDTGSVDQGSC